MGRWSDVDALIEELMTLMAEAQELLDDSAEEQWLPSRYMSRTDPVRSDPTGDTTVDPRRLALRREVEATEAAAALVTLRLSAARRRLKDALSAWAGEPT